MERALSRLSRDASWWRRGRLQQRFAHVPWNVNEHETSAPASAFESLIYVWYEAISIGNRLRFDSVVLPPR